MGLLNRLRRKKEDAPSPTDRLLQSGRIVEGKVLDVVTDSDGKITQIIYSYNVGGVEYESSQSLAPQQQAQEGRYVPGAQAIIRYDPRQPANSIVV